MSRGRDEGEVLAALSLLEIRYTVGFQQHTALMIYCRHQGSGVRGRLRGYETGREGKGAMKDCVQKVLLSDQHSGHIHQGPWISATILPMQDRLPRRGGDLRRTLRSPFSREQRTSPGRNERLILTPGRTGMWVRLLLRALLSLSSALSDRPSRLRQVPAALLLLSSECPGLIS